MDIPKDIELKKYILV